MKVVALTSLKSERYRDAICLTFEDGEGDTPHHLAICFSKKQARESANGCDADSQKWLDGRLEGIDDMPDDSADGLPDAIIEEGRAVPFMANAIGELRTLRRATRPPLQLAQLTITMPLKEFQETLGSLLDTAKGGTAKGGKE